MYAINTSEFLRTLPQPSSNTRKEVQLIFNKPVHVSEASNSVSQYWPTEKSLFAALD